MQIPLNPLVKTIRGNSRETEDIQTTRGTKMKGINGMGRSNRSKIWKKDKRVLIEIGTKGIGMVIGIKIIETIGMEMRKAEGTGIIGMIRK